MKSIKSEEASNMGVFLMASPSQDHLLSAGVRLFQQLHGSDASQSQLLLNKSGCNSVFLAEAREKPDCSSELSTFLSKISNQLFLLCA